MIHSNSSGERRDRVYETIVSGFEASIVENIDRSGLKPETIVSEACAAGARLFPDLAIPCVSRGPVSRRKNHAVQAERFSLLRWRTVDQADRDSHGCPFDEV